jgi:hypothetical protein
MSQIINSKGAQDLESLAVASTQPYLGQRNHIQQHPLDSEQSENEAVGDSEDEDLADSGQEDESDKADNPIQSVEEERLLLENLKEHQSSLRNNASDLRWLSPTTGKFRQLQASEWRKRQPETYSILNDMTLEEIARLISSGKGKVPVFYFQSNSNDILLLYIID